MSELFNEYFNSLVNAGLPRDTATKCANIFISDNPSQPNLGRSEEDRQLTQQALQILVRNGFIKARE